MQTPRTVGTVERERESYTLDKRVAVFACSLSCKHINIEDSFKKSYE